MPTRNFNLTEHFDHFVQRQVSSGRYSNASEIVREALRRLEEQEQERVAKLQALRQAGKQDELRVIIFGPRESWGGEMTKWVVWEVAKLKGEGYRIGVAKTFFEHGTKHVRQYLRYEKS